MLEAGLTRISIRRWRRWWTRSMCCWVAAPTLSSFASRLEAQIRFDGRSSKIVASDLPAPFHFAPSFAGMSMLGWKDKLGMARGLMEFFRGYPAEDSESVEHWLKRTRQTELSIRHFWNPILMATLNDRASHCSTRYAGKVFHELFIKSSTGGRLGIPTVPLSEFYQAMAQLIESRGGVVRLRTSVEAITQEGDGRWRVNIADSAYAADSIILALPFEQTQKLLPAVRLNERFAGR